MRLRQHSTDDGVAALEFALVLPVFMAIVLGAIDYGYFFFVQVTCTNAAREGARAGVVEADSGDVVTTAENIANQYLTTAQLDSGLNIPTATASGPDGTTGLVEVTVSVTSFQPLVGFVPTPSAVNAVSSMRWEMFATGGT